MSLRLARLSWWQLALALLALLLLTAPAAPAQDLFPLPGAATWTFEREGAPGELHGYQVLPAEDFHGVEAVVLRYASPYAPHPVDLFYTVAPDGDVLLHGRRQMRLDGVLEEVVYQPARVELDLPLGVGWAGGYTPSTYADGALVRVDATRFYTCTVESMGEVVSTPAGDFTAARVATLDEADGAITRNWYAPGVGRVRVDFLPDGLSVGARWLLWDYELSVPIEGRSWGSLKAGFGGD